MPGPKDSSGRPAPPAPPEDESADPVGDGHSDAEWAERHPAPSDHKPEKKPAE